MHDTESETLKMGTTGRPQVEADAYFSPKYDSRGRFVSYWNQINDILRMKGHPLLEVGIGNGFVSGFLRDRNVDVTTMDIDEALGPDVVGSVLDMPFETDAFEATACFEVLEHLPYDRALQALREMKRVSRRLVFVSVPDREHVFWVRLKLPFVGEVNWQVALPRPWLLDAPLVEDEHFWELGVREHGTSRLKRDLADIGYTVLDTYRDPEMSHHRFFVLSTSPASAE